MFCMFLFVSSLSKYCDNVSRIVTSSVFFHTKKVDIVISKEEAVKAVLSLLK